MGPYRVCANNGESDALAREVEEFRAALARRTPRVWVGVLLTVLATVAPSAALFALTVPGAFETAPPPLAEPRCETHFVQPAVRGGDPIPMTICR